jgi:hypothetical protein
MIMTSVFASGLCAQERRKSSDANADRRKKNRAVRSFAAWADG